MEESKGGSVLGNVDMPGKSLPEMDDAGECEDQVG